MEKIQHAKRTLNYERLCPICSTALTYNVIASVLGNVVYQGDSFLGAWSRCEGQTMPYTITSKYTCTKCRYEKDVLGKHYDSRKT